jgi:hypothetical protein
MKPDTALRLLVWACALAGVFIAFAWPFAVSADPGSGLLMAIARAVTAVLLAALAGAACMRAARARRGRGEA